MRGILDLNDLCMTEIFKYLKVLDFCSVRQCSRQLRNIVDDHLYSVYFVREQRLDFTFDHSIKDLDKILRHYGRFARHLKISMNTEMNLLLDVIANNCGDILKGLALVRIHIRKVDMQKFTNVFNHLENLELHNSIGSEKSFKKFLLGHEFPHLKKLILYCQFPTTKVLQKFFMTKRNIKKLRCGYISGDIFPLIVKNAADIEDLSFCAQDDRHLMLLAQLGKLKALEFDCFRPWNRGSFYRNRRIYALIDCLGLWNESSFSLDRRTIIALIKELSVTNVLETLWMGTMGNFRLHFTDEFCYALSNLTNLKILGLNGRFSENSTESIEMLGQKLSKLESLTLRNVDNFPYKNLLVLACKSEKFRALHLCNFIGLEINNIQHLIEDFVNCKRHRCFVSGDPLYIYLHGWTGMEELLTQDKLQAIEMFGNIKIIQTFN